MTDPYPSESDHIRQPRPPAPGYEPTAPGYELPAAPVPAPAHGYEVPGGLPMPTEPWYGGGRDPLVTPPEEGFSGWFSRLFTVLRGCWSSIALIALSTFAVPTAVFTVTGALLQRSFIGATGAPFAPAPGRSAPLTVDGAWVGVLIVVTLVFGLAAAYLGGVANAAVVWTVTRSASRQPAPLGDALRYGFRHGLRLLGWGLLYGLMIFAGACACLIPGLYFALAGCLYIPFAIYRRGQNPIGASFSMVNASFGAALGRMLLLAVMVFGVQIVLEIPITVVGLFSQVAGIALSGVLQFVSAVLTLVLTVGGVLLFAELWRKQVLVTTAHLNQALDAR